MVEYFSSQLSIYFLIGAVGFLFGAALMVYNHVRNGLPFPVSVIGVTLCIYGGLLGTRILYVAVENPYLFVEDPLLALAFWQGGLSWLGGPILGSAVFLIFMRLVGYPAWSNLGAGTPGLALAHAIARFSCLNRGCCYGAPTDAPWAIYSDVLHTYVHPTQVYDMVPELAIAGFLQFLVVTRADSRKFILPLYVVLLTSHRFVTEAFRGEPPGPEWIDGLRFYQSFSIVLFAAAICALALLWRRREGTLITTVVAVATLAVFVVFRPVQSPPPAPMYAAVESHVVTTLPVSERAAAAPAQISRGIFLVATRRALVPALDAWRAFRATEGYNVVIEEWDRAPHESDILRWIRSHDAGTVTNVLIVGDVDERDGDPRDWHMPAPQRRVFDDLFGSRYAYDAPYGDLNADGAPDVPVGRLPVRGADELRVLTDKICAADARPEPRNWNRAVIWTGAIGITDEMDYVTAELAKRIPTSVAVTRLGGLAELSDPQYALSAPDRFLGEIADPAMFSFIACHGAINQLRTDAVGGEEITLTVDHVEALESEDGPLGPLFVLACEAGRFDEPRSIGESFLANSSGPTAVIAASGRMQPLTNYFFSVAMLEAVESPPETLGEYCLDVQRRVLERGEGSFTALAASDPVAEYLLGPHHTRLASHLPRVLRNECLVYNLLGDPATKLRGPVAEPPQDARTPTAP